MKELGQTGTFCPSDVTTGNCELDAE